MTTLSTTLFAATLCFFKGFGPINTTAQKFENIDLTRRVCEISEIKERLLTKDQEGKDAVFVFLDTNYFDREIFDSELSTPFYIWELKTLFFYEINYWLLPTSIGRTTNEIYYKFRTCSFIKDEKREYFEGQVTFIKAHNDWQVRQYKITKVKYGCGTATE